MHRCLWKIRLLTFDEDNPVVQFLHLAEASVSRDGSLA